MSVVVMEIWTVYKKAGVTVVLKVVMKASTTVAPLVYSAVAHSVATMEHSLDK